MKRTKFVLIHGILVAVLAVPVVGCGGPLRYTPRSTSRAPEADATIVAHINRDQSNTRLQIRVEHLAPPDRIQPGATAYVAWSRAGQAGQWMRIGALQYNPSSRIGELETIAPDTSFDFQITAESAPTVGSPSPNVVVQQRIGAAPEATPAAAAH
jgi:hypothetical protein